MDALSNPSDVDHQILINNVKNHAQKLNSLWKRLNKSPWHWQLLDELIHEARKLAKTETFTDILDIKVIARKLMKSFHNIQIKGQINSSHQHNLYNLLKELKTELVKLEQEQKEREQQQQQKQQQESRQNERRQKQHEDAQANKQIQPQQTTSNTVTKKQRTAPVLKRQITIGLYEKSPILAQDITQRLTSQGFDTIRFSDPESLQAAFKSNSLDLALIDLLNPNIPLLDTGSFKQLLPNNPHEIPIIMLAGPEDTASRLIALRSGVQNYISKPLKNLELIEKIEETLEKRNKIQIRVLVIDDEDLLTDFYQAGLAAEGFTVKCINQPLTLLQSIESFKPDVLMVDYQMPECNGLELAEILRGDTRYRHIPIIFLSSSNEISKNKSLIRNFGNSFLEKPVNIDQLSCAIRRVYRKANHLDPIDDNSDFYSNQTDVIADTSTRENKSINQQTITRSKPTSTEPVKPSSTQAIKKVYADNKQNLLKSPKKLPDHNYFLRVLQNYLGKSKHALNAETNEYVALLTLENLYHPRFPIDQETLAYIHKSIAVFLCQNNFTMGSACRFADDTYLLHIKDNNKQNANFLMRYLKEAFKRLTNKAKEKNPRLEIGICVCDLDKAQDYDVEDIITSLESASLTTAHQANQKIHWVKLNSYARNESNTKNIPSTPEKSPKAKIIKAINDLSFQLLFQPIIKPESENHIFEALIRLEDEDGKLYQPNEFLPYVEETLEHGYYTMDRWVIERAFSAIEQSNTHGAAECSIVIKLWPDLSQIERLLPFIFNMISNSPLHRSDRRIYFSTSAEAMLSNLSRAKYVVDVLHKAHCGFMIDRWKCDAESIQKLAELKQVDFIKIDPDLQKQNKNPNKLSSVINQINNDGDKETNIIAGVIEDARTFAQYWDLNIRYFQGYFINRPTKIMQQKTITGESLITDNNAFALST